jgi:hypothetical protein
MSVDLLAARTTSCTNGNVCLTLTYGSINDPFGKEYTRTVFFNEERANALLECSLAVINKRDNGEELNKREQTIASATLYQWAFKVDGYVHTKTGEESPELNAYTVANVEPSEDEIHSVEEDRLDWYVEQGIVTEL